MKKKLVMMMLVLTLVFTGCGNTNTPDYGSAQTYYDMYINKIKEVDPSYLPALNEEFSALGVTDQIDTLKANILDSYNILLSKVPEQELESLYGQAQEVVGSAQDLTDLGISGSVENIQKNIEKFGELPQSGQDLAGKSFNTVLDLVNNIFVEINKQLPNITYEQMQDVNGFDDLIEEYIQQPEVTKQIEETMDGIQKQLEEALKNL